MELCCPRLREQLALTLPWEALWLEGATESSGLTPAASPPLSNLKFHLLSVSFLSWEMGTVILGRWPVMERYLTVTSLRGLNKW